MGGFPDKGLDSQLLLGQSTPQQSSREQEEQLSNTSKSKSAAEVLGPGFGSSNGEQLQPGAIKYGGLFVFFSSNDVPGMGSLMLLDEVEGDVPEVALSVEEPASDVDAFEDFEEEAFEDGMDITNCKRAGNFRLSDPNSKKCLGLRGIGTRF